MVQHRCPPGICDRLLRPDGSRISRQRHQPLKAVLANAGLLFLFLPHLHPRPTLPFFSKTELRIWGCMQSLMNGPHTLVKVEQLALQQPPSSPLGPASPAPARGKLSSPGGGKGARQGAGAGSWGSLVLFLSAVEAACPL
jgi:hypothetical protein